MKLWMRQDINSEEAFEVPVHYFVEVLGMWAPIVVQSQKEKDFLEGYALMMGKDTADWICVDGIHKSKLNIPPTYIRIPDL